MLAPVITRAEFVDHLEAAVPEANAVVSAHLSDNDGELLPHLLMSDLLRLTVTTFHEHQRDVTGRLLAFVDSCLRHPLAQIDYIGLVAVPPRAIASASELASCEDENGFDPSFGQGVINPIIGDDVLPRHLLIARPLAS